MSKGQVLVVDWKNKKLLTNQHNNSDDSFYQNKQTICDGEVTLFTTKNSGGNWQMRMRVEGHRQYHQKSLRTKNYETAKERAKKEHAIFKRSLQRDSKGLERGLASIGRQRIDYLSDERIREAMLKEGYVKTFEERTKRKRYIRTHTHRLIAKAEANIKAVEKGTFGVGH